MAIGAMEVMGVSREKAAEVLETKNMSQLEGRMRGFFMHLGKGDVSDMKSNMKTYERLHEERPQLVLVSRTKKRRR